MPVWLNSFPFWMRLLLIDVEKSADNLHLYFTKPFVQGLHDIIGDKKKNDNLVAFYIFKSGWQIVFINL